MVETEDLAIDSVAGMVIKGVESVRQTKSQTSWSKTGSRQEPCC